MNDAASRTDIGALPLLACLLAIAILGFVVFGPFLVTFAVTASFALLMAPLQARLSHGLGDRPSAAAGLLVTLFSTLFLLVVLTYGALLRAQAAALLESITPLLQPGALERLWSETLPARYPALAAWVGWGLPLAALPLSDVLSRLTATASHLVREGAARLGDTVLHVALFFLMLFFLLRDGPALGAEVRGVSPFSRAQEEDMLRHLSATVRAGILALVLVPLAEAATAVIGFAIFGLPAPVFWGVLVGFAGLIPVVGAPLAWVPAGIYLLVTGPAWRGIGLLLYGIAVISVVGNIVKPLVLRGGAQIHPLLGFLAILGGVFAFGAAGLIVGPVILSLALSALRIYRFDVLRWEAGAGPNPMTAPAPLNRGGDRAAPRAPAPGPSGPAASARTSGNRREATTAGM